MSETSALPFRFLTLCRWKHKNNYETQNKQEVENREQNRIKRKYRGRVESKDNSGERERKRVFTEIAACGEADFGLNKRSLLGVPLGRDHYH